MAALTRTNSRATPGYKDYVNFLGGYKNGKKDEEHFTTDVPPKNFPLTSSSSNTSSSSMSSDVTDFSKNSVTSYNTYLENSKNKKFQPVKPNLEEKETKIEEKTTRVSDVKSNFEEKKEKTTMKTEIFIEIQPVKSVSEVSKMFEKKEAKKPLQKSNSINSRISIFEKQVPTENRPKIATKPGMNRSSPPKIDILPSPEPKAAATPSPPPEIIEAAIESAEITNVTPPPVPPPMPSFDTRQKPAKTNDFHPPAPVINNTAQPKLQATLTKGPQTTYSVSNPNGAVLNQIDRNDPMVKKLVYGTLRGLYGAYHDKASDMLATLPKNMVVKSNGVQDRIEQIAANGDLDKLNGRINPKLEQE